MPQTKKLSGVREKKTSPAESGRDVTKKLLGYVSVDSGQVVIVDPCYIDYAEKRAIITKDPFPEDLSMTRIHKACCEQTLSKNQTGQVWAETETKEPGRFEIAVASNSGWGDGKYPVYVKYSKYGRVKSLEIVFIR